MANATIKICTSTEGDFIRAICDDGERDITPSNGCDLSSKDDVVFEVEHDLVGGFGEGVDWKSAAVIDQR